MKKQKLEKKRQDLVDKPAKKPDWTEYPSMVRFYKQAQTAESSLEPDEAFHRPPSLVFGEARSLDRSSVVRSFGKPDEAWIWNKTESCAWLRS